MGLIWIDHSKLKILSTMLFIEYKTVSYQLIYSLCSLPSINSINSLHVVYLCLVIIQNHSL
jgi:hypothetical protein